MPNLSEAIYADAVDQAARMLLAVSVRPELKTSLVSEVTAAVIVRRGQAGPRWRTRLHLRAILEEIVARALAILSAALRQRLPGTADEVDGAFGDKLWMLLGSLAPLFPKL